MSLVNYVSPETKADEMLVDESAGAVVTQLGDALTEIEVNGHFFGECSLTLVFFERDSYALTKSIGEANKLLGSPCLVTAFPMASAPPARVRFTA